MITKTGNTIVVLDVALSTHNIHAPGKSYFSSVSLSLSLSLSVYCYQGLFLLVFYYNIPRKASANRFGTNI